MSDQSTKLPRSILPIPSPTHIGLTTYGAKDPNTKFLPIETLYPPKDAPNVLIVLMDDVGFAAEPGDGQAVSKGYWDSRVTMETVSTTQVSLPRKTATRSSAKQLGKLSGYGLA